jgi:hypothetical protein
VNAAEQVPEPLPIPVQLGPTSPWGGLSHYQRDVAEVIHRAAPEIPLLVVRAAVGWIRSGELSRHYGVGFSIAYSIRGLMREDFLA